MPEIEPIKNSSRRRLAKGLLAGPAVLASITSKNALGASYACAVSGQQSGNISRGTPLEDADCTSGFGTRATWAEYYAKNATRRSVVAPVDFGILYQAPAQGKQPKPLPTRATYNQIFVGSNLVYPSGVDATLAQSAATVYLNADKDKTGYHVKPPVVWDLYKVASGSVGAINNSANHKNVFGQAECKNYLRVLAGM